MNLSEQFHVTNGVRPGGVLRPYFFAVYLDDLSLEPSNIKAGYYSTLVKSYWTTWRLLMTFVCFFQVYVGCKEY